MSLIHTLYPHHRRARLDRTLQPPCPDPATLLVCLPAEARHGTRQLADELYTRLRPHIAAGIHLDYHHFALWREPDPTEAALLIREPAGPQPSGPWWYAGGPVGLLDLDIFSLAIHDVTAPDLAAWQNVVAGTPPAASWASYLDAHHHDPAAVPLDQAIADFEAQPRIAAMAAANTTGAPFSADMFGPGLQAAQADDDTYAGYQIGCQILADGLVTLDGQLRAPSYTPLLIEQTLAERDLYHADAYRYLSAINPTTLLLAVNTAR